MVLRTILSLPFVVPLAACAGKLSTLEPAGHAAAEISTLWWVMLAGAAAIFLLVMVLLGLAFIRRGAAKPQTERVWILGGGLVFTTTVLIALLTYGIILGERLIPNEPGAVLTAEGEARQWQWTFRQPAADGAVIEQAGVLHIPAGAPVDVRLTSTDVIHSFWVPRLAGKLDAIPGKINVLRIQASAPGVYEGACAEYCGVGHARMRLRVVAHDPAGWAAFQAGGQP